MITCGIGKEDARRAASGRWREILTRSTGVDFAAFESRRQGPCPRCGGRTRFRLFGDFQSTGGAICNRCGEFGDGFATLGWLRSCSFPEAVGLVAEACGLAPAERSESAPRLDPLAQLCEDKRLDRATVELYGAKIVGERVAVPMYGADGSVCGWTELESRSSDERLRKGKIRSGDKAGLYLAGGKLPEPGEAVAIVEGFKDASALHGLGFVAVGINGANLQRELVPAFRDCAVTLVPDRDAPSVRGFMRAASRLFGIAASVRLAHLPGEVRESGGRDVRDLLAAEGAQAVRDAIERARPLSVEECAQSAREGRYELHNVELSPVAFDATKQSVKLAARVDGERVGFVDVATTGNARKIARAELKALARWKGSALPSVRDDEVRRLVGRIEGDLLAGRFARLARAPELDSEADGATVQGLLREAVEAEGRFRWRSWAGSKVYSESERAEIGEAEFYAIFRAERFVEACREGVDAPVRRDGSVDEERLAASVERRLRRLWGTIRKRLPYPPAIDYLAALVARPLYLSKTSVRDAIASRFGGGWRTDEATAWVKPLDGADVWFRVEAGRLQLAFEPTALQVREAADRMSEEQFRRLDAWDGEVTVGPGRQAMLLRQEHVRTLFGSDGWDQLTNCPTY